jgi:hypothetical protein
MPHIRIAILNLLYFVYQHPFYQILLGNLHNKFYVVVLSHKIYGKYLTVEDV